MSFKRKQLNISLIFLALILAGLAVCITGQPSPTLSNEGTDDVVTESLNDTIRSEAVDSVDQSVVHAVEQPKVVPPSETAALRIETSRFDDAEPRDMTGDHPFKREAIKILSGHLEETDSVSRRKILSYCEHLRTAYTTRDIDFIRQVFSDNALIIVGQVVKTGHSEAAMGVSDKVRYSVRTKQEYLKRLAQIFKTKKQLDVNFSDFTIMRHPTMAGIYGVTLRQQYATDGYSDDGYLFLLWDFRDPAMPLIHVRTWQPASALTPAGDDLIDLGDFNLE